MAVQVSLEARCQPRQVDGWFRGELIVSLNRPHKLWIEMQAPSSDKWKMRVLLGQRLLLELRGPLDDKQWKALSPEQVALYNLVHLVVVDAVTQAEKASRRKDADVNETVSARASRETDDGELIERFLAQ